MRHLPTAARYLLGLIFFVFGLNFFLHFIPMPTNTPAPAAAFGGAMMATGYLFLLVKVTEVASGILLLANRFVPLALTLLAPIIVNIFCFHLFLEGAATLPLPLVILALEIYLAYSYRAAYLPMLQAKVSPATSGETLSSKSSAHATA